MWIGIHWDNLAKKTPASSETCTTEKTKNLWSATVLRLSECNPTRDRVLLAIKHQKGKTNRGQVFKPCQPTRMWALWLTVPERSVRQGRLILRSSLPTTSRNWKSPMSYMSFSESTVRLRASWMTKKCRGWKRARSTPKNGAKSSGSWWTEKRYSASISKKLPNSFPKRASWPVWSPSSSRKCWAKKSSRRALISGFCSLSTTRPNLTQATPQLILTKKRRSGDNLSITSLNIIKDLGPGHNSSRKSKKCSKSTSTISFISQIKSRSILCQECCLTHPLICTSKLRGQRFRVDKKKRATAHARTSKYNRKLTQLCKKSNRKRKLFSLTRQGERNMMWQLVSCIKTLLIRVNLPMRTNHLQMLPILLLLERPKVSVHHILILQKVVIRLKKNRRMRLCLKRSKSHL